MSAVVRAFFEERTSSVQYIVGDPSTRTCAIIDPVLDFDEKSGSTATRSADNILRVVRALGYEVGWILDTHPHADHLSAAGYLKDRTGAPTAIGCKVTEVQAMWRDIYELPASFPSDGRQWDKLFADGETFHVGRLLVKIMLSPGHTLASITYVMDDAAFIHDTLFMPDVGTARADFPGGSARELWHSIQHILGLPNSTRLFTGHDYPPKHRDPAWQSTVGQQKTDNVHLRQASSEDEFVRMREQRDKALPMPRQIMHALQVNIAGGRLPEPTSSGRRYLKIPLNALPGAAW